MKKGGGGGEQQNKYICYQYRAKAYRPNRVYC